MNVYSGITSPEFLDTKTVKWIVVIISSHIDVVILSYMQKPLNQSYCSVYIFVLNFDHSSSRTDFLMLSRVEYACSVALFKL